MSSAKAILAGALIIAGSILIANGGLPRANASAMGPYVMMHHSNTTANVGVFRMDATSGEISYCYLSSSGSLNCTNSVK